jgi:type II secretory pathway component GspD/PulD (secretin)
LNQLTTTSSSSTAVSGTPFFRIFAGNKNLDIENTFVDLLKIYGKVETISSPKIATMNNQRAIIKVTKQDVYFDVDKDVTNGVVALTYTPKFIDVGLTLDVTPQVDDRDNIILNVHPIMSEKVSEVTTPDGYAKVPVLDVREVDTIVKIKEGETVVIGGLIKNKKSTTDTGTKWFMDIPVIKHLFKVSEEEVSKSELVIFLTPRITYGASN